jgi:enamine deaminase RidA (YjgF/YER057c/UK114 family)
MRSDKNQPGGGECVLSRRLVMRVGTASFAGLAFGIGPAIGAPRKKVGTIEMRLAELGVMLPRPADAVATYAPYRIVGNMVYIAGQGPFSDEGAKVFGKVGRELTVEEGAYAARLTAMSVMAQAKAACGGDLERVVQWVRLTGYVNSTDDFTEHPKVINGASDLLVEVFGERGLHARSAIGVNSLPYDIAVEIEATFQLRV